MNSQVYAPRIYFDAAPKAYDFFIDDSFVTGIKGPLGSGKSYTCCAKIMRYAMTQEPGADNVRRTRWAVIRNTYPELLTTTIKTWKELFPEESCGPVKLGHPITHNIKIEYQDPNIPNVHMEVMFLALDKERDVAKLKSLDLTGAWVNEAVEVPEGIIDMLTGRVGRYPQRKDVPATWHGIIMDTNAPDDQNWWYEKAEQGTRTTQIELEDGSMLDITWSFYNQPPAILEAKQIDGAWAEVSEPGFDPVRVPLAQCMQSANRWWCINPEAENTKYLVRGYYQQQIDRKSHEWIQRYLQAKYIFLVDGKSWVPEYSDDIMGQETLVYNPDLPLIGGIDAGGGTLNPAAVLGQIGQMGDWRVLYELSLFDIGLDRFADILRQDVAQKFGVLKQEPEWWLDPAGRGRDQIYETAVEDFLRAKGFKVSLAPTNNPTTRRDGLVLPRSPVFCVQRV